MTAQDLARLITSYRWLSQELASQVDAGAADNCQHIREEVDALFLKIVKFPADNPYISCAQMDFLISAIAEPGRDDATRAGLCDLALSHLTRISKHLGYKMPRSKKPVQHLDSVGARLSVRTGSA